MAESGDGQEKVHDPTPSRIQKARKDGDVAISADTHVALIYGVMTLAFLLVGDFVIGEFGRFAIVTFEAPISVADYSFTGKDTKTLYHLLLNMSLSAFLLIMLPIVAVLLSAIAQNALVISPKRLKPKWSKLSPIENIKKKYGPSGLFEFLKTLIKLLLVLGVTSIIIGSHVEKVTEFLVISPRASLPTVGQWAIIVLSGFTLSALIVAAIDLPWQRTQNHNKLKMTQQELKEETKKNEGDPHLKQERRQRAEDITKNRMLLDVPKADVVIVNPTHYAVALTWSREKGTAPVCVAKGVDEMAAQIRKVAGEAGVPIRRDPPTARAIHATVDIGQEIRPDHYAAVAAGLHFADEIRRKARERFGAV